jgi:hypothetical protein
VISLSSPGLSTLARGPDSGIYEKPMWYLIAVKLKPTPEQVEAVRYAGALGHSHFALSRGKDGQLRVSAECSSLAHCFDPRWPRPEAVMTRLGKKRHLFRVA